MKKILFVDDDPHVLRGLQRMLHPMRAEWEAHFASGGKKALEMMAQSPFDIVVSDMRMPGMDGAQLLEEIINRHPDVVRLVLSGQSDEKTTLRSVVSAHQYLTKPCDAQTMIATIKRACALRDLLSNPDLKRLISRVKVLPSVPSLYLELMQALRSPDASIRDVGRVVSRDVGMTAKILQLVNSSFFGLYHHISSAEQAVSILGLRTIKALVLTVHLFSQFKQDEFKGFPIDKISRHSMATGALAKRIATAEGGNQETADDTFMAGMLHDAGKILLADQLSDEYAEAMDTAREKRLPLWEAERKVMGATHGEVGAYLLGLWGLSDPIVETLAFHHCPKECPHTEFGPFAAVHVADALEHEQQSHEVDGPIPEIDQDYVKALGLSHRLPAWRETCQLALKEKVAKND